MVATYTVENRITPTRLPGIRIEQIRRARLVVVELVIPRGAGRTVEVRIVARRARDDRDGLVDGAGGGCVDVVCWRFVTCQLGGGLSDRGATGTERAKHEQRGKRECVGSWVSPGILTSRHPRRGTSTPRANSVRVARADGRGGDGRGEDGQGEDDVGHDIFCFERVGLRRKRANGLATTLTAWQKRLMRLE